MFVSVRVRKKFLSSLTELCKVVATYVKYFFVYLQPMKSIGSCEFYAKIKLKLN